MADDKGNQSKKEPGTGAPNRYHSNSDWVLKELLRRWRPALKKKRNLIQWKVPDGKGRKPKPW